MACDLGAWVAAGAVGRLEWVVPGYWPRYDLHVSLPEPTPDDDCPF